VLEVGGGTVLDSGGRISLEVGSGTVLDGWALGCPDVSLVWSLDGPSPLLVGIALWSLDALVSSQLDGSGDAIDAKSL
jgi:hypothetical protein